MEANKQFSYAAKVGLLTAVGDHLVAIQELMVELSALESRSANPNHGDFYEMNAQVDDLIETVVSLIAAVEPMTSSEKSA